jgi:hypothetical protein
LTPPFGSSIVLAMPEERKDTEPRGFAFAPINYALFGAALAVIIAGYVLLGRGSVTAAPMLLALGYIVLGPAALLVGLSGRRRGTDVRSNNE